MVDTRPLSKFFQDGGKSIPGHVLAGQKKEIKIEEAKVLAREQMTNKYHLAISCMMAPSEKGGVVDERLRVHGFKDLRVVDACVFPTMQRGTRSVSTTEES